MDIQPQAYGRVISAWRISRRLWSNDGKYNLTGCINNALNVTCLNHGGTGLLQKSPARTALSLLSVLGCIV